MWERYSLIALLSAEKEIKDEVAQYELNSLVWCQKRSQLAKIQYYIFDKIQGSHPNDAVLYLYDSVKKGCYLASERFSKGPEVHLKFPLEEAVVNLEDMDVSELFVLALRSFVGLRRFRDEKLTFRCFERILSLEPLNVEMQSNLGSLLLHGLGVVKNISEAVDRFRFAATRGYAIAQYELAGLYHKGVGVFRDENEAIKWYRCAAVQGHVESQDHLGSMLSRKGKNEEDVKEGIEWFVRAAEQGSNDARVYLYRVYKRGNDFFARQEESLKWLRRAAIDGNESAAMSLARMYEKGKKSPQNNDESAKWYRIAYKYGDKVARRFVMPTPGDATSFGVRYHQCLSKSPAKNDIIKLFHENREYFLQLLKEDDVIEQEDLCAIIQYVSEISSSEECSQLLTEYLPCLTFSQMVTLFESHVNLRECLFNEEGPLQDPVMDMGLVLFDLLNKYKSVIQDKLIDSHEREAFHKMIYVTLSIFLTIARETQHSLRRDFSCVHAKLLLINFCEVSADYVVKDLEDIEKVIAELNISNVSGRGLCGSVIR